MKAKKLLPFAAVGLILAAVILLGIYQCPFYAVIGIPCPGCHMTRAIWALMQGDIALSFYEHPMLIPTILTVVAGGFLYWKKKMKALRILLYTWAFAMFAVWIVRLCLFCPDGVMKINSDALFFRLFSGNF